MTSLLGVVRSLASPVLGPCHTSADTSVAIRHRDTGHLFGLFGEEEFVAFPDEAEAKRFIALHACEPDAWEPVLLAG